MYGRTNGNHKTLNNMTSLMYVKNGRTNGNHN